MTTGDDGAEPDRPVSSVREQIALACQELANAGIEAPARDVRRLLAHAMGVDPSRITLMQDTALTPAEYTRFRESVTARLRRVPVSQIVGARDFYGRTFRVTQQVLDPRPETETLVAIALEEPFANVLDLGTGSGCILLTLLAERPSATGVGTDLSPGALDVAAGNAERLDVAARVTLLGSHWFRSVEGRFDLIVSNPPYIAAAEMEDLQPEVRDHEPRMALTDEHDGLSAYREIAAGAGAHLAPGGRLLVEIGAGQGAAVSAIFREAGLDDVAVRTDLDGRDRVVSARNLG